MAHLLLETLTLFALVMLFIKVAGRQLVLRSSGVLRQILGQEVDYALSPEELSRNLFDPGILQRICLHLSLFIRRDFHKFLLMAAAINLKHDEYLVPEKVLVPENYWSGCPPNPCW